MDRKKLLLFIIIAIIVLAELSFLAFNYIIIFQDGKSLACEGLPEYNEAERIFYQHNDTVEQIENISPGLIWVSLEERCDDRAEVGIYYDSLDSRKQIKEILGDSFFELPYVMFNV